MTIVIVDYGMGNVGSIQNMFRKVGADSTISSNLTEIQDAEKLVLPGVGSFDRGMIQLRNSGIQNILEEKVIAKKTPILGICLGMQLFSKSSEEGSLPGLGWIDAKTIRFKAGECEGLRIPHMGWNYITLTSDHPMTVGLKDDSRFYFVHSFHVECADSRDVLATAQHGDPFCAIVRRDNVMGTQFHPEKSHRFGQQLLMNFAQL